MNPIYSTRINTDQGEKVIAVYNCDLLDFDEPIDILTTSAFVGSYAPVPRTLFYALHRAGISVSSLAERPEIDLREFCGVWLSRQIEGSSTAISRIGCIEMADLFSLRSPEQNNLINSIKAYFRMLDTAEVYDIPMGSVALPLLGSGNQHISARLTMIPIINECVAFLKRNGSVKRICFIERSAEKAELIANSLQDSYLIKRESEPAPKESEKKAPCATAFISYASPDKNIADNLCAKLERENVKVWYAPRDVKGAYASAIANAIEGATHFIVILSQNSMKSQHVLNEIDLAFQNLPDKIKFKPLRIDDSLFTPSFKYYLCRQHWLDAIIPPLEERLEEFVASFLTDL